MDYMYGNMEIAANEKQEINEKNFAHMKDGTKEKTMMKYEPTATTESKTRNKKDEYMQSFSVHGLSRICTGSRKESGFWSIVVFIGILLSIYVIYDLASKYFKYEVYTSVNKHVTSKNILPQIIFCDFNLMTQYYFSYCGLSTMNPFFFRKKLEEPKFNVPCDYRNLSKPRAIKNIIKNNTNEWSNGFFHVTRCSTNGGTNCASDEYLQSFSHMNNTCFSLNWKGTLFDTYGQASIVFTINKTSTLGQIRLPSAPIMTTVQEHDVQEVVKQQSVFIETDKNYLISVAKTLVKRLPYPFPSRCIITTDNYIFPGKYSRSICIDSLELINMMKTCGDVLDYPRQFMSDDMKEKYGRSNQTIAEAFKCISEFILAKKIELDPEECPIPCQEMELSTTFTFDELDKEKKDVYKVNIQLQEGDSYQVIEEKQLFTWEAVAGQIGGFLGLVVGASFISIIEIIAYLGLCLIQKFRKKLLVDH